MTEGGSYMGSKISLISQSKIRYEGCLYSIDTNESTVTLSQVRSMGTENRPTERPVVPGDEVYSFIKFKASDIKDLHVCELPKVPPSNIAQDPAVLQHSGAIRTTPSGYHHGPPFSGNPGPFGSYGGMSYNQFGHVGAGVMGGAFGSHPTHPPPGLPARSTPPPMARRSPTMEQGVQASGPVSPQKDSQAQSAKAARADKPQASRDDQGLPQRTQESRRRGSREEKGDQKKKETQRQESREKKADVKTDRDSRGERQDRGERQERGDRGDRDKGGRGPQQGSRQNWQGYNQGRRGRGRGPRSPVVKEKVGSDFDFTAAHFDKKTLEEDFKEKLKIDGSVNGDVVKATEDSGNETQPSDAPEEEETAYYDSTKSFFDNISCDAINNKGQRPNWKEERKMNCETFGIAYARNRGRGGYRGGYYRGGYRGNNYQGNNYQGNYQRGRGQGRGGSGGRSNRSSRGGRGGWKSGSWNDYSLDGHEKVESGNIKTEKTAEATS